MGIRFRCHQCGHELHVKDFQGGKRSKCPECETRFRIPLESAERSIPLDSQDRSQENSPISSQSDDTADRSSSAGSAIGAAMGTLAAKSTSTMPNSRSEPEVDTQYEATQEIESVSIEPVVAPPAWPQAILEAPGATWYVRPPAGGQYGPAPANIFCEWLTEHRVTRDSLVWRDGWPQWLVAEDVFTDCFGSAVPQTVSPFVAPVAAPIVAPANEQTNAPGFVVPTSLSDRALAARKRQRKKNYMVLIGILAAISVGLVIALVAVLMRNS